MLHLSLQFLWYASLKIKIHLSPSIRHIWNNFMP
ncbi:hypothetical protein RSAG8_00821, partial [Rhizoctonia solani AG-8 WAC10335]